MHKLQLGLENTLHISVLITTLNAAETIEHLIKSLKFAKEIIIIDSFSKDNTIHLASKHDNVIVYQKEFIDYFSQQQYAISKATNDWVIIFDQDEEIPKSLTHEISEINYTANDIIYRIKRDSLFMEKNIKRNPQTKNNESIIFNKNQYTNTDKIIDLSQNERNSITLNNQLPFYTTFDSYTRKTHNKSTLEAKILYHKKKKPSIYHFFILPFCVFWKQYLFNLHILHGKEGFILSYITAFSVFKKYINLWLMYRRIK